MVKQAIKSSLNKVGWDLIRYIEMPERPFRVLPYLVTEELEKNANFFFLQVGANDGVADDPLHDIALRHKLSGLLVEPLPNLFERLKVNYAGQPGIAFERCAIGHTDGEASLYRARPDAPVPSWVHLIASFNRRHLTAASTDVPELEEYIEEVKVPSLTLRTLLRKHDIQDLTLLVIDTEGFDCEIVNMALDAGLRPAIVNYEFIHAVPQARVDTKKRLMEAGYSFIDVGRDTLAVRR